MAKKKHDTLTAENKANWEKCKQKWEAHVTNTEPANRAAIEPLIEKAYVNNKVKPPKKIEWFDSPAAAAARVTELVLEGVEVNYEATRHYCEATILFEEFTESFLSNFTRIDSNDAIVRKVQNIHFSMREETYVELPTIKEIKGTLARVTTHQSGEGYYIQSDGGILDIMSLMVGDFLYTEFGAKACEPIMPAIQITENAGWWYPLADRVIIADRPSRIVTDKQFRLHNETGAAMMYRDGWGVYSLNGVRMKKCQVMTPAEQMSPRVVLEETNVERRRELVRKIGIQCLLDVLKHKVIDKETVANSEYELLAIELSAEVPEAMYLKMLNPSLPGVFHLEGVEGRTVQAALNFRAKRLKSLKGDWKPAKVT